MLQMYSFESFGKRSRYWREHVHNISNNHFIDCKTVHEYDLQILRKNNLIHHNCHKLDDAKRVPNSTTRLSFYDSTTSLLPPPFEHNASFLLVASVVRGCFVLKAAPQSITDAKLGVSCPDFQCICVAKE